MSDLFSIVMGSSAFYSPLGMPAERAVYFADVFLYFKKIIFIG